MDDAVLTVDHATVRYQVPGRRHGVFALRDVSFELRPGVTLGVVGESGCGKSTLAQAIVNLVPLTDGAIRFEGRPVGTGGRRAAKLFRRSVQLVFQEPQSSLNPRMRVADIIAEPLVAQGIGNRASRRAVVAQAMEKVGLPLDRANRFPHEFSGGQRQRISIARALVLEPRLIVLDEPTSALDISVQAQILNLLLELQAQRGLTYVLISHDVSVVRHLADRIIVMYLGQIVEEGPAAAVLQDPRHPYTRELLASVPMLDGRTFLDIEDRGDAGGAAEPVACVFRTRCVLAGVGCEQPQKLDPVLRQPERLVRCWRGTCL